MRARTVRKAKKIQTEPSSKKYCRGCWVVKKVLDEKRGHYLLRCMNRTAAVLADVASGEDENAGVGP